MDSYSVLHVIDALSVGGAERVLVDSCNILHAHGIAVSVLVLTESDELAQYLDPEIAYLNLNRTNKWSPLKLIELNSICRRFDIVHVHLRYNLKYVGLSKLFFGGKFKLVLHDHFGDIEKDQGVPFGLAFFMRRAWFIGVHPLLTQWAIERVGISEDKVFVLPNTVIKSGSNELVKEQREHIRILIVSNFRASKNLTFAVNLIECLAQTRQIRVDIVGKVVEPGYYEMIKKLIFDMGLTNCISLNHNVSNAQEDFWKYDLALHTAKLESGPLVLLEYLAHGLPFVAYKTGEVSAALYPHFPSLFQKKFDVNDWSKTLSRIDQLDQQKLSMKMKTHFEQYYGPEKYFQTCGEIYRSIMKAQSL